jgi:hypothetical protein
MGLQVYPAPSGPVPKTRKVDMLVSGTDYTVPAGVTYVIATLQGGGGGGAGKGATAADFHGTSGQPGNQRITTVTTTPGSTISYSIGAGGTAAATNGLGGDGGNTTFTGATTADGGAGGAGAVQSGRPGSSGGGSNNAGGGSGSNQGGSGLGGGAGGIGYIKLEYFT